MLSKLIRFVSLITDELENTNEFKWRLRRLPRFNWFSKQRSIVQIHSSAQAHHWLGDSSLDRLLQQPLLFLTFSCGRLSDLSKMRNRVLFYKRLPPWIKYLGHGRNGTCSCHDSVSLGVGVMQPVQTSQVFPLLARISTVSQFACFWILSHISKLRNIADIWRVRHSLVTSRYFHYKWLRQGFLVQS